MHDDVEMDPDDISDGAMSIRQDIQADLEGGSGFDPSDNTMEWEHEHMLPETPVPEVQIRLPNVAVTIRQSTPVNANIDPFARRPRIANSPTQVARQGNMDIDPFARRPRIASSPAEAARQNIQDWLDGVDPNQEFEPDLLGAAGFAPVVPPIITRQGRISKPVYKYDAAVESRMQRDTRDALNRSKPLKRLDSAKSPATARKAKTTVATATQPNAFARGGAVGRSPVNLTSSRPATTSVVRDEALNKPGTSKATTLKPKTTSVAKTSGVKSKTVSEATGNRSVSPTLPSEEQASKKSTKTARTPP
jgi:hypothetical protein